MAIRRNHTRRAIIEDSSSESEPEDLSITEIDHSNPSLPSHSTPRRNALQEKESDTVQCSLLDIQENSLENGHTSIYLSIVRCLVPLLIQIQATAKHQVLPNKQ